MFSTSNAVYNLGNQCRAVRSIKAPVDVGDGFSKHWFVVGAQPRRSQRENGSCDLIHLLEYDEEANLVSELNVYTCRITEEHVQNISLSPHPNDAAYLFALNSVITLRDGRCERRKEAVLYRLDFEYGAEERKELQVVKTLPTASECRELGDVKSVLWRPIEDETQSYDDATVVVAHEDGLSIWKLGVPGDLSSFELQGKVECAGIECVAWDPHHVTQVSVGSGCNIESFDIETFKSIRKIGRPHGDSTVRCLDYNPNKPFYILSGGDDRKVRFWDLRNLQAPLKVLSGHSHWIWEARYNNLHDQLVISSSSDAAVALWRVSSISSAPLLDLLTEEGDLTTQESTTEVDDAIIRTYDNHEDSVYSCSWSATDAWIFASLSYDGKFVIHHVPSTEKYKILL